MNGTNATDKEIAAGFNQLNPENFQFIVKLICLCRCCPGFSEELMQLCPNKDGVVSKEQFAKAGALVDEWMHKEGWAEILRSELGSVGVAA